MSAEASPAIGSRARAASGLPVVVIAGALLTLSGGVLWRFGLNYTGLTGAPFDKIHPATYGCALTLLWRCASARDPVGVLAHAARARPSAVLLMIVSLALFVQVVLTGQHNMSGTIDSFVLPALLALLLVDLDAATRRRLEIVVHAVLIANGALGLVELAIHQPLFPFRIDGVALVNETRSSALQGHPLESATVTALYTLALLAGAGRSLRGRLRQGVIALEFGALVAFGGRSALVVTAALGTLLLAGAAHRALRRGRVSVPGLAGALLVGLASAVALFVLAQSGFFDAIAARFASDGGSAEARVAMFDMFDRLAWRDFITGPDTAYVDSMRRTFGLESGIENPVIFYLLYHGALFTLLMMVAVALFVAELARGLGPGKAWPILAFVILINTYEGIASKSLLLAKFLVLMTALYPPATARAGALVARARRGPVASVAER